MQGSFPISFTSNEFLEYKEYYYSAYYDIAK